MNKSAFSLNIDGMPSSLVTSCNISAAFVPGKDLYLPSKQYAAIWDTGATGTVISDRVVQELGLKPSGVGNVFTASNAYIYYKGRRCDFYYSGIHAPLKRK